VLQFGTELVTAADRSLTAMLGASPGASTAVSIMLHLIEQCFPDRLSHDGWAPKLKAIIPSYGRSLIDDAGLCRKVRTATAAVLKIGSVD
jgi:malate dehydrogenase (quinone)